jgi:hypothetical protein
VDLPDGPYGLLVVYDVPDYIDLRNAGAGLRRSYAADAAGRLLPARGKVGRVIEGCPQYMRRAKQDKRQVVRA